jgi:hypothetical protein
MNKDKYQLLAYTDKSFNQEYTVSRSAVYLLHGANCCPSRSARIRHTPVVAVRHEEGKVRTKSTYYGNEVQ